MFVLSDSSIQELAFPVVLKDIIQSIKYANSANHLVKHVSLSLPTVSTVSKAINSILSLEPAKKLVFVLMANTLI